MPFLVPPFTLVSTATRALQSTAMHASTIASLIASHNLSGWPEETLSEVKSSSAISIRARLSSMNYVFFAAMTSWPKVSRP